MVKASIRNLAEYQPKESLTDMKNRLGVSKLVRLSANESAAGTSPEVKNALFNSDLNGFSNYPDDEASELRNAVSDYLHINSKQLIFGNGSDELISLICQVFLTPGDSVIQPSLTFGEYENKCRINGAIMTSVNVMDNGKINLNRLLNSISYSTKLIWLCNPNNPTGEYLDKNEIIDFLSKVPKSTTVVIDEAYIDYVITNNPSMIDQVNRFSNVIILRTFSKVYGLASLRIGYAVAGKEIASLLSKIRGPYNLSEVDDVAGAAAQKDIEFVQKAVKENQVEMKKWKEFFNHFGYQYYDSQANFILFQIDQSDELVNYLAENGYLLKSGLKSGWLRVSMGTAHENEEVRNLIKRFYA